jgi:peptidoglycan/xylan/chitin deacetylase (PgdA/CDA1 family)
VYLSKTPPILKAVASHLTWNGPRTRDGVPAIYLTFDDGPHPEVTREVMRILARYRAPATFFCVGQNLERYPEVAIELRAAGHAIGNHLHQHESGWETPTWSYLRSYVRCRELVGDGRWFRPPYGRISRQQAEALQGHTRIVMWDVLSGDWDATQTPDDCFNRLRTHTRPGAIVVFHDSERAAPRMLATLPRYLDWLADEGYECFPFPGEHEEW